ncbi:carbamoyl-phosphate synthase small chain [hydrocarbon metagenome]|uniref:carbamoyl-phosphate synthase (glutamine-hydrolyzing) n=1 Tax=hydrocarbon metagenome TaxID=938273 RepID=A0A0W8FGJ5_9ZZZZ
MESLTDPSYAGQILMFTYPLIGNYGVDSENFQSAKVHACACVAREIAAVPAREPSIARYFEGRGLLGICNVDTRSLTIKTRIKGSMRAALLVGEDDGEYAVECARTAPRLSEQDLIAGVSCRAPYRIEGSGRRIAVVDLGIKKHILVSLRNRGADLWIFPHDATPDQIAACEPETLFISNGPGDPRRATHVIRCVRELLGELQIAGICMGIQVTALALGAETYKMKFGHRGANQPVRDRDGRIFITTQNHGFAVDSETLPEGCSISYANLNDGTLEGFEDRDLGIRCVQFHPEAHGGPRDTETRFFDAIFRGVQ